LTVELSAETQGVPAWLARTGSSLTSGVVTRAALARQEESGA
jgi:hypothetical protein